MKIKDFIFNYDNNKINNFGIAKLCKIQMYDSKKHKKEIILIIDLSNENNKIASTTNYITEIILGLEKKRNSRNKCIFIELDVTGKYTEITINEDGIPDFKEIEIGKYFDEEDVKEIEKYRKLTVEQQQEVNSIVRKKNLGTYSVYDLEYKIKKYNISNKKKSIEELKKFFEKNPKEREEILKFFKKNLSFFGEFYANNEDEYIVFAEFPINNEKIDFVVFHGRSRMNVTIIEVKGANFTLFTKTGYKQLNSNITKAETQIRKRVDDIEKNYEDFRKKFYKYKEEAVKGKCNIKNILVGAKGDLKVDPEKDIKLNTVIIGGRTEKDKDVEESKERTKYEKHTKTSLESWDTWINKLEEK